MKKRKTKQKKSLPLLIVVSGPTGAGKTVLVERLLKKNRGLSAVSSVTTRPPGKRKKTSLASVSEYRFVSAPEFGRLRAAGKFIETARVHGFWYGTLAADLAWPTRRGKIPIKVLDVKGFTKIRHLKKYKICSIFVTAESLAELKRRVIAREPTITKECLKVRLATARREVQRAKEYDAIFINHRGELARTVKRVAGWIDTCRAAG
ncbi:MAG: guanylate kinase [Parcubacteria group bacterium]